MADHRRDHDQIRRLTTLRALGVDKVPDLLRMKEGGPALMERPADLGSATDLVVIAGVGYNPRRRKDNHVLHRERQSDVITQLAGLVTDLGDEVLAWMEWPQVSLVFLNDGLLLAEYGVLSGGGWVRTPYDGDRAVVQAEEFGAWLDAVGRDD